MRGLVEFGVRRPIVGSLLMWFLVIGGVYCLLTLRREFFPKVDPDAAAISIVYPGASPEEVEESMARKIEDAVADLDGVKRITSIIAEGGGGINVEFNDGRDIQDALDDTRVAIDGLEDLPDEADRIRVTELQPNFPVIMLTLFGDTSETALKQAARRVSDPEHRRLLSERAKAQHAAGKLGRATWTETSDPGKEVWSQVGRLQTDRLRKMAAQTSSEEMRRRSYQRKMFVEKEQSA